jgi:hypothetical protein
MIFLLAATLDKQVLIAVERYIRWAISAELDSGCKPIIFIYGCGVRINKVLVLFETVEDYYVVDNDDLTRIMELVPC